MDKCYITLRDGKRIYVETYNKGHKLNLLILGKYDLVCFQEQIDFYSKHAANGSIITFHYSDHRPHDEEPTKFTDTVVQFINS